MKDDICNIVVARKRFQKKNKKKKKKKEKKNAYFSDKIISFIYSSDYTDLIY